MNEGRLKRPWMHRIGGWFDIGQLPLHDSVDLPVLESDTRIRGVRLRPAAVAQAFGVAGAALHNSTVPLAAFLGDKAARLLQEPKRLDEWARSIVPDDRVDRAVRPLDTHTVTGTADALGITGRHLRRLMLEHTGLSPKALQRVRRFQRFVRAADAGMGLAAAAAHAGYADQPHLTREVRSLAGVAPMQLVAERGS